MLGLSSKFVHARKGVKETSVAMRFEDSKDLKNIAINSSVYHSSKVVYLTRAENVRQGNGGNSQNESQVSSLITVAGFQKYVKSGRKEPNLTFKTDI